MPSPLLIVIEGIDGTGKTSHAKRLARWVSELGHEVILSREPTDGPWGSQLRASAETGRLAPDQELEYFLRDRQDHVSQTIQPALAAGKWVILDRYYFSTMAYQGARGLDPAVIRQRNEAFAPRPDVLLILDLDVDTALERIGGRGDQANAFEQRESLQRCRDIFLALGQEEFVRVIDADGSPDEVAERIQRSLAEAAGIDLRARAH